MDKFQQWHSEQIVDQLQNDLSPIADPVVKFPLNVMKPLILKWMEDLETTCNRIPTSLRLLFKQQASQMSLL